MPWADGTACGRNENDKEITHWCMKSECVPKTKRKVMETVDGQWSEWQG